MKRAFGWGGFTLVEVVLAMAVLCVCLTLVMGLMPVGMAGHRRAAAQSQAMGLLEKIRGDFALAISAGNRKSSFYGLEIPRRGESASGCFFLNADGSWGRVDNPPPGSPEGDSCWRVVVSLEASMDAAPISGHLVIAWPAKASLPNAEGSAEVFVAFSP